MNRTRYGKIGILSIFFLLKKDFQANIEYGAININNTWCTFISTFPSNGDTEYKGEHRFISVWAHMELAILLKKGLTKAI